MGKRIKLTGTERFLLGLTALFAAAMLLTWLLTPHASQGDYTIEAVPPAEKAETLRAVNINTAGADELESLPGIGPVLAQRIVDYRTEHGPFRSAEELTQVEGIGRATMESIQDHIITEDRVE